MPTAEGMLRGDDPGTVTLDQKLTDDQKRRLYFKRWLELDAIYNQSWRTTHQDIVDFIQPNRGQFLEQETNKGDRKDGEVINNVATVSAGNLESVMDIGITSEASDWFTLAPANPEDAENEGVREACHEIQAIMFAYLAKSTFYKANRNVLGDLVGPGIGVMLIEEDDREIFRCTHIPIGRYRVYTDARGRVVGLADRYLLTAQQMVEEFGWENVSAACRQALKNETIQVKFRVLHFIEPRSVREHGRIDKKNKPFSSIWIEIGMGTWAASTIMGLGDINAPLGPSGILREDGFDEQPFVAPRWNAIGFDAYGKDSPGWRSLGDTKSLQALELGGAKMIAKIIDPPMNAPDSLKNASLLPGAVNHLKTDKAIKFEPAVQIPPEAVKVLYEEKQALERRINRTFYGDVLFLISSDQSAQPKTAEEIRAKKQERLLQLGGVFARYADEGLKPAIARIFAIMQRRGLFRHLTDQLKNVRNLKIDFQNSLVTAQKTIGFTAVQQLVSFGIGVAQARAAGADKLNGDELMDTAADMLGVKPSVLVSDDVLAARRQQQADQQQASRQGEAMTQAAPAIKALSDADPERLRALLAEFGPNAVAQGSGGGA